MELAELAVCGACVLVGLCLTKTTYGEWWRGLPIFRRKLVEGIGLVGAGATFLWVRWKGGRLRPSSPWEFRNLLFDIAFVIGGAACLVEAMQAQ